MNKKLLRKKLALMLATLKKKRKYYCEVEYIKSDGIDLMYINPNLAYFPDFEIGVKCDSNSDRNATLGIDGDNMLERFGSSLPYWTLHASGTTFRSDVGVGTYADAKYKDGVFSVNGVTFGTKENTFPFGGLCLFKGSAGNNNRYKMSIYFFKAWDSNGGLVRDMIPVLDWNYVPCMYDRVTEQLFYNAGTGDFIAGREIHPVEYLESTSDEYIDTGIKFDGANTKIELKTYEDSLTRTHSICGDDGNFFYYFRGTGNWAVGYNGTAANIDSYISVGDNVFVMDKNNVYVNGVLSKTYTASSNVSSYNTLLFNRKTTRVDKGAVTMYYCKIWNNDVLVRDYIPAIDENGVGYMFDRVSHTIYDNAGTGAFKYPAREVEYLESTGEQYIDTGVTSNLNTVVEMNLKVVSYSTNNTATFFGGIASNIGISTNISKTNTDRYSRFGTKYAIIKRVDIEGINSTITIDKNAFVINGQSFAVEETSSFNGPNMCLFKVAGIASEYNTTTDVYSCKLLDSGVLVRDFVPSYKDGVLGMYDKTNDTFYPNAGTGTFATGKIVEPEYE